MKRTIKTPKIYFFDTGLADMVIESDGHLHTLEIKRSVNPGSELIGVFSVLDKGSVPIKNLSKDPNHLSPKINHLSQIY